MSELNNAELIEQAKANRTNQKRQLLAQAIAVLDERVADITYTHDIRIAEMQKDRARLETLMTEGVTDHQLDGIVARYS